MANIARTFDDLAALAPESPTELIELVHDFIQSIRPDGSFLSMNRACREALGYSSEEFRRLSILDIIHPLGRSFCEESFRYVLAGGTLDRIEVTFVTKDGRALLVEGSLDCLVENGQPVATRGIYRDITELRRLRELFRQEHQLVSAFLNTEGALVVVLDPSGRIVLYNKTCEQTTGHSFEAARGRYYWEVFLGPKEEAGLETEFRNLRPGRYTSRHENAWLTRDGQLKHVAWTDTVLVDAVGAVTHVVATGIDVTERRKSDQALLRSESRLKKPLVSMEFDLTEQERVEKALRESDAFKSAILEAAFDCIICIDHGGRILEFNQAAERTFGYSRADILGMEIANLIVPQSLREQHRRGLARFLNTGVGSVLNRRLELPALRADGSEFPVELVITVIPRSAPPKFAGYLRDITEQKRTEQELRQGRANLEMAQAQAHLGSWEFDPATETASWSLEMFRLFERDPSLGAPLFSEFLELIHPEDLPGFLQTHSEVCRPGESASFEYRTNPQRGRARYLHASVHCTRAGGNNQLKLTGTLLDITERKRAEGLLRTSEERFRSLVEESSDGIFLADGLGTIQYSSPAVQRILGYSPEGLIGRSGLDLVHPDNLPYARDILRRAVESTGEHVPFLLRAVHKDGTWRWLDGICSNHLHNPAVQAVVVNFRDVSESRRAEEALRASEDRYRRFVEVSPDAIFVNRANRVVFVNPALLQLLGATAPEQLLGKSPLDIVHPDFHAIVREWIDRIIKTGETVALREEQFLRLDGTPIDVEVVATPFTDRDGSAILVIARDISERKRAEEERAKLQAQMLHAQKLESLGVLAGGIAHDFNNLLTAMMGYASLARAELPSESTVSPMLQEIENAAQRAAELAQQMLAYAGKGKFFSQIIRLETLVREMTKLLGTVVSKKAVLHLALEPATTEGDPTQIRQIVMNLITNASDSLAGQNGAIAVRTGLCHAGEADFQAAYTPENLPEGEYAFVEVEDSGCGMSEATLAKIFDPFFTTKFTGRGLGLAAVLGIVRGHGGTIQVKSASGQGTTFRVLLPRAIATRDESPAAIPERVGKRGSGTILVVEDEANIRTFSRRILEGAGFRVLDAVDGRDGLEVFAQSRAEIVSVLLDLTMPRMDGIEFLRQLRLLPAEVPVLLMSGYTEHEISGRVAELGVGAFLQKPFRQEDLLQKLEWLLTPAGRS